MEVESKEADIYVNYSRSQPDNIVVVSSDFTYEMKQLAMNAS
jgi:predicted class III extradiol MEMO1 family dioxygenase